MRIPIDIVRTEPPAVVQAELFDDVTVEHFLETQLLWRPVVVDAAKALHRKGVARNEIPAHWHWNWESKASELGVLAFSFIGIECGGKLQGLMKLDVATHSSRLSGQEGKPVVYVDYLETAPWNVKSLMTALGAKPEYSAVGTRLIEAAVRRSIAEGFRGRVALHSVPGSERFYLEVCGMAAVEPDSAKQNLLWCEFTPEQARAFIGGENA